MKAINLLCLFILCNVFLAACKKKDDPTAQTQKGDIKATAKFTPWTSSSYGSFYHYIDNNALTITLMNSSGAVIATQYSSADGTPIDLGEYEYGNYSIKVEGPEMSMNMSTGTTSVYTIFSQTKSFSLNNTTVTENFTFSN
ncbi:MAG TPA: hypothetical protein VNB90_07215 [Cytophagaceae bacterium]|jgi:hypothetical protein|nr:hypothetical protein [Cytophagaceae bacterium]